MIRRKVLGSLLIACVVLIAGCSNDNDYVFQKNNPDPSVKLWEVLDETPAMKSLFSNLNQHEFNLRLSRLVNSNPRLMAELMRRNAEIFYGYDAPFPQAVADMSDSFCSFHNVYCVQPDSLDRTVEMIKNILDVDSGVMMEGSAAIKDTLIALRNLEQDEDGVYYNPYPWNLFGINQELSDIGYDGIDNLIENVDIVYHMYDGAADLNEPAVLMRELVDSLVRGNVNIETRVADIIDSLKNSDDVLRTEHEIADWMVANPMKSSITHYMMTDLYPMLKDPELDYAQGEKNVIIRGKGLLDEEARILSATPNTLSGGTIQDDTLLTKWLMNGFYNDVQQYDNLERVDIFDVENNDMLNWADSMVRRFNAGLKLAGSSDGVSKERVQDILWDGWTFDPYGNGSNTFNFKGVFYINNNDPETYDAADGYTAKMAKTRSTDTMQKSFRLQINDILNGNNDGDYFNDYNDVFKHISYAYSHDNPQTTDKDESESQIEAIMTNLQLYLLSYYYSPERRKWAWTPEDGEAYFGEARRNLKDLYGGLSTSLRNLVVLDEYGMSPSEGGQNLSMAAELLYVLAGGHGVVDPVNAPGELTLRNCLKSMGATQLDEPGENSLAVDGGIFGTFNIRVLGDDRVRRRSTLNPSEGEVVFSTQPQMPSMELLQPGTFRVRNGLNSPGENDWMGKFSASQGDIRGIVDENGNIVTSNWTLTEIALACWEGYGPYTYKGRAPNGSDCKYKNDWYTDEYRMIGNKFGNRGLGMDGGLSKYHVYEKIYRPEAGKDGFVSSGYSDSEGSGEPLYGYVRDDREDGTYVNVAVNDSHRVKLDCDSREEAIRKNYRWLMNEKKYMFLIPIHAYLDQKVWGGLANVKMEMYVYTAINANGVVGVSRARRYTLHGDVRDNAVWPGSGAINEANGDEIRSSHEVNIKGKTNHVLKTIHEGGNEYRFTGVSFKDKDFCVALDYTYDFSTKALGFLPIPGKISEWIMNSVVNIPSEIWGSLGDSPVLPPSVGENFNSVASLGDVVYTPQDLMYDTGDADTHDIYKFKKFYDTYYADAGLFDSSGNLLVRQDELPAVPRVHGVAYPVEFDEYGYAVNWKTHTGDSKGKFEDMLGIMACMVGTIHEDGTIYADIDGSTPASYGQINNGDIAYFAKDGYRANIDNLILLVAALNEHKKDPNSNQPLYNANAWINKLVDHDPAADQTIPGSRAGVLPVALSSKYANINHMDPIVSGVEDAVRHTFRMYLNNFMLTQGYDGEHGSQSPDQWQNLPAYYLLDDDGNRVDYDDDGYPDLNPNINWNIPINRLRYFADDRSLDQLKSTLDLVKDCSQDQRFVTFLKRTLINMDNYLVVKYLEQHPEVNTPADALLAGAFQLMVPRDESGNPVRPDALSDPDLVEYNRVKMEQVSSNLDDIIEFLDDFKYGEMIQFIQEARLNDIEKWYNFSFADWGDTLSPGLMKKHLDELNAKLVKYFGINVKEGLVNGIFILDDLSCLPDHVAQHFVPGEKIWGYGKYQRISEDEFYLYNGNDIIEDIGENSTGYFVYIDLEQYIQDFPSCFTIEFDGIRAFFDFKMNADNTEEFEDYCHDYRDKWYRGGIVECPNIYSGHNYDLRMDWAMDSYNQFFFNLEASDFAVNQPLTGEGNPSTMLDWMFGWDGNSDKGVDLETELNFVKNEIIGAVYDTEVTVVDPDNPYGDMITDNVRDIIRKYRSSLEEKMFAYEYGTDGDGNPMFEDYTMSNEMDMVDGHRHMLNNIADLIGSLLNPNSPQYKTGRLFTAWQNFVEAEDVPAEDLLAVRDLVGNLLYDKDTAMYTDLFTRFSKYMPGVMEQFQGRYDEILELAVMAMQPDGIGTYMLENMEVNSSYDSWQMVDELNYLLQMDAFQNYQSDDTFWWQMGNLMEDFAILMEESNGTEEYNFYGGVEEIFE